VVEEGDFYKVYVVNDNLLSLQGEINLELIDFNGKKLWKNNVNTMLPENSSSVQFTISKKDFEKFPLNNAVLSVSFKSEISSVNSLYYFVKPKDLALSHPNIQLKFIDDFTLEITSNVLAKNVYIQTSEEVIFSDNYFDILPNNKVIIKLPKPLKNIKVKSLFDTLK
jgi:beta-mannosidase